MRQYNNSNLERAKSLRKEMTSSEKKLWYTFLKNEVFKWRKQTPILSYIVDFYCPKAKLIIELDGDTHYLSDEAINYDKKRTQDILGEGFYVIRFTNNEIRYKFKECCEHIRRETEKRINSLG